MKVGLMYIDSIFNQDDIDYLNEPLDVEGIDFRIHDKGREITANIDEISSAITIILDFIESNGFFVSIGAGATWDGFKTMVKYVFIKKEGKKFYKVTSKKLKNKIELLASQHVLTIRISTLN